MGPDDHAAAHVDADLQTVLCAWHDATVRWEQTHEQLQAEVRRLTAALAMKQRQASPTVRADDVRSVAGRVTRGVRSSLAPASLYLNLVRRRVLDDPLALDLVNKAERSSPRPMPGSTIYCTSPRSAHR